MMSYEKLDVYQCAIQFLALSTRITSELPRGHAGLADQLKRASMSIPLSIAEGAGKRTKADCRKYFDIARGSAMECGAAIGVTFTLGLIEKGARDQAKTLIHRVVAMLTKLSNR